MRVQLKNGSTLVIDPKPFASGGEGELYRIQFPVTHQHLALKIYKQDKRTLDRSKKIQYLIDNPPSLSTSQHNSIIWPKEIVYINNSFAGFTMPIAKGEKLELLCHNKLPENLKGEWSKFDPVRNDAISLRLKLCFNIAVAIHQIHELDNYVIVDMKPENIIVSPNGFVSIIDLDSIQISQSSQILFHAPVTTPEYTPPEYYRNSSILKNGAHQSWDCFSIAVIFYRLLCGIHPYSGSCNSPFDWCTGISEMVENGLFPNGKNKHQFKIVPPPHKKFYSLPSGIRELFIKCFEDGHSDINCRPSVNSWCEVLAPEDQVYISRKQEYTKLHSLNVSYNTPIAFVAGTAVDFPSIDFSIIPISGTNILFRLFMSARRKETFIKINESKAKLKGLLACRVKFENQLIEIIKHFESDQELILKQEQKQIKTIISKYEDLKTLIIQQAKELIEDEKKEIKEITDNMRRAQIELKQALKIEYDNLVGNRKLQYDKRCNLLEEEIKTLERNRQYAKESEMGDPNRLAKYLLSNYLKEIFKTTTAAYVKEIARHINTAADFVRIDDNGRFLLRNNTWLKLTGVGYNRASELQYWQNKMRDKDDKSIVLRIDSIFAPQIKQKGTELDTLKKEMESIMKPFNQQYLLKEQISSRKRNELIDRNKQEIQLITKKYDNLNEELRKLVSQKIQTFETEINSVNVYSKEQILIKNSFYTVEIHRVRTDISNHIDSIKLEYNNLQNLLGKV